MRLPAASLVLLTLALGCRPPLPEDELGDEQLGDESSDTASEGDTHGAEDSTTGTVCDEVWIVPEYVPPNLLLLVDTSSSMVLETWDDDGDPLTPEVTRWSSARRFVKRIVDEFDATMNLGVLRFPSADACPDASVESANCSNADACLVDLAPEVAVGPGQGPAIFASLPGSSADAIEIAGGTPTSAAFTHAREHLSTMAETSFSAIVLITDGAANCGEGLSLPESFETYDAMLATVVGDAYQLDQIPTYVVGIDVAMGLGVAGVDSPVIDAFEAINEVALAGGMPQQQGMELQKFYDPSDPQALFDVIPPFRDDSDCTVDLSQTEAGLPTPEEIDGMAVAVDGISVSRVDDCATEWGWTWIVEGEVLSFCGYYCEEVKTGASIHITYCNESA